MPLHSLPVEVVVLIYCKLPLFSDVLALANASCQLRAIWVENASCIYFSIGPSTIPCEKHARKFRNYQAGRDVEHLSVSSQDVINIMRNACIIEKAIVDFEHRAVRKVKCIYQFPV
jgi:hypothetical protein